MVMIGQHRRLSEPLRWTRAGRVGALVVACSLLAAIVTVIVLASLGGSGQRAGCIEVTFPSTLGGSIAQACGVKARSTCADPAKSPALAEHGALRQACRQARLPYGTGVQAR